MLKEKIFSFIGKIRSFMRVEACPLVSRDMIISGKYINRELNEPRFGALLATILACSESVGGIVTMKSLEPDVIRAQDPSGMMVTAGENFLIAAILKKRVDPQKVHYWMFTVGKTIGEVM